MILQSALPFIAIALFLLALLSRRKESEGVFYSSWFGKVAGALGWVSFAGYCYFETFRCLLLEDYVRTSFALIFLAFSLLLALLLLKTSENEDLFLFRTDIRFEEDLKKGIFSEDLKKVFKTNGFSLSDNALITKGKEDEWVIADEEKFIARKEAKRLNLYKMRKFFARKGDGKLNIYKDYKVLDLFFLVTKVAVITAVFYFPFSEFALLGDLLIFVTAKLSVMMLNLLDVGVYIVPPSGIYSTSSSFHEVYKPIEIILACTAIQSMALFTGVVFGVTAPIGRKLKAFLVSVPVIYGLNILRNALVGAAYFEQWFGSPLHSFFIAHDVLARIGSMIVLIVIAYAVFVILPEALDLIEDLFRFFSRIFSTRIRG